MKAKLFNFGFLEFNVLTHHRVVLLEDELVRRVALVFIGGIEVAGVSGGHQF